MVYSLFLISYFLFKKSWQDAFRHHLHGIVFSRMGCKNNG